MKEKLLMQYRRQQGFTVLELLVVLLIIVLLASFVGPRLFLQVDPTKDKNSVESNEKLIRCAEPISS